MSRYRRITEKVEAEKFYGIHAAHREAVVLSSGIVQFATLEDTALCQCCGEKLNIHGSLGGDLVCPGDYILKREDGSCFITSKEILEKEYEKIDDNAKEQS